MYRKWVIRIIAILMAIMMALSVIYVVVGSLTVHAATQSQIDTLKQQQKEYEKKKQELQSQINSLQYQQKTALDKKNVLDTQIQVTQQEIDNINDQIAQYDQLIAQKEIDVKKAQTTQDTSWGKYKVNMRTMEENGTISYISVIFQANSFSDLLARIDCVGEIMQYDIQIYEQLKSAKEATINAKNALQTAKTDQEASRAELIIKEADQKKQLEASNALLKKLEGDIGTAKELYEQESKAANQIQSDINQKSAELKKQQQASSSGAVKGSGNLIWPIPSCDTVTSKFGMRYHPIYHEYRMHSGIDIGADYGSNVDAVDAGTIIISEYSSSYGNYIVVDHGNGMTTLYAHMSSRLVKVGDKVQQGTIIGKVGSTGNSTGAHCHFEISVNGTRVNPLNYYSHYTLSPGA